MPRPRTGLGQGLEALVPPIREPNSAISRFSRSEDGAVQWEVAVLRKLRKRRCRLVVAPSAVLEKPAHQVLKTSTLLALGALGAAGWELTAVSRGKFYLKRHAVQPGD
jgi:hypothetical protein